jgi:hypothetical protein
MEAQFQEHYETSFPFLFFLLAILLLLATMLNMVVTYSIMLYAAPKKQEDAGQYPTQHPFNLHSNNKLTKMIPERKMTEAQFQARLKAALKAEVEPLRLQVTIYRALVAEAQETLDANEVVLAATDDKLGSALLEIAVLRALASDTSSSAPGSLHDRSSSSSGSQSGAARIVSDDADSIVGSDDLGEEGSSDHDLGAANSLLDRNAALDDELAELGGWVTPSETSEDSDGNVTDRDADGVTDDESEGLRVPSISGSGSEPVVDDESEGVAASSISGSGSEPVVQFPARGRLQIRPLAACRTKGSRNLPA